MIGLEEKTDVEKLHLLAYPHNYDLSLFGEEKNKTFLELANKLKVLEIVKEKKVNVAMLYQVKNCEEYNAIIPHQPERKLTQEEYDLLKEILKWNVVFVD